jgi:hypothetical protein
MKPFQQDNKPSCSPASRRRGRGRPHMTHSLPESRMFTYIQAAVKLPQLVVVVGDPANTWSNGDDGASPGTRALSERQVTLHVSNAAESSGTVRIASSLRMRNDAGLTSSREHWGSSSSPPWRPPGLRNLLDWTGWLAGCLP